MSNTPPEWVGDAVFYQIFPDRFARTRNPAELVAASWLRAARRARAVGGAADPARHQGRRPVRDRRANRRARRPRRQRALPQPDLLVSVEPPLPRLRLPGGRSAARRRRRPSRAARRGARARHSRRTRRRLQPLGTRLLAVPPPARSRSRLAVPRLVRAGLPTSTPASEHSTPIRARGRAPATSRSWATKRGGAFRRCQS